jgi:DNA-binding NarL/FixJ family response regulator
MPTALVISDFPIIAATARAVFDQRYAVEACSWTAYIEQPERQADLVVVDVTAITTDTALNLLARALPAARIVVCSLHQNEVQVYRIGQDGPIIEAAFPSLLSLAA